MILRKKEKEKDIKEEIPVDRYDDDLECFVYPDGSLMNFYQINTKDLVSSNVDDIEMDCFKWAKFYKTYGEDIQLVSLKFPCNTQRQQEYWQRKLSNNRNPVFTPLLQTSLNELIYREKHTTSREFYLQVWDKNEEEMQEHRAVIQSTLEIGRFGLITEIPKEKKIQALFKLNNKNSLIF